MAVVKGVLAPVVVVATRQGPRYGVGEVIHLSVTVRPNTANVATFGGIRWKLKSGVGCTVGAVVVAAGTATLTLGDTAGTAIVEAWGEGLAYRRVLATTTLTIVAPSDLKFTRVAAGTIRHTLNTASAGFIANVTILPSHVSFANVQTQEGEFKSKAAGAFAHFNNITHMASAWIGTACNVATGNNDGGPDEIYSQLGAPRLDPTGAPVVDAHGRPTFVAGSFEWEIPWHYRLVGDPGDGKQFVAVTHKQRVNEAGRVDIEKHDSGPFGASFSDPTATYGLPALGFP